MTDWYDFVKGVAGTDTDILVALAEKAKTDLVAQHCMLEITIAKERFKRELALAKEWYKQ